MSASEPSFWAVVDGLRERDPGYRREAYGFVVAALGAAVRALSEERRADPARRHLSGRELVEAVAALARIEFGPLADLVFREWGLAKGSDVGRIVFQLVESGQLSAREEDTMEDFLRAPDPIEALGMTGGDAEHRAGQHGRSGGGAPAPG